MTKRSYWWLRWAAIPVLLICILVGCGQTGDGGGIVSANVPKNESQPYDSCDEALDDLTYCKYGRIQGAFVIWGHKLPAPDAELLPSLQGLPQGKVNFLILVACMTAAGSDSQTIVDAIGTQFAKDGTPVDFDAVSTEVVPKFCPTAKDDVNRVSTNREPV